MPPINVVSYFDPDDYTGGYPMQMSCIGARIPCRVVVADALELVADRSHFLPWFLIDMLGETDAALLFVDYQHRPSADLIRYAMGSADDVGLLVDGEKQPVLDGIFLANNDIVRSMLDCWVQENDETPDAPAAQNIQSMLRRYRTQAKIRRMPTELLHHRNVADMIGA